MKGDTPMLSRRGFFIGAASLIAAPTIIKITNLMPVRPIEPYGYLNLSEIVRTTLRLRMGELAEHLSRNNVLLERLLSMEVGQISGVFCRERMQLQWQGGRPLLFSRHPIPCQGYPPT